MPSQEHRVAVAATLIRLAVASVFVIHGIIRTANRTVSGFGGFLDSWGFPADLRLRRFR